jgi:peptidoglycan L-alanyl-D-glutamate endopeptidase CwlK
MAIANARKLYCPDFGISCGKRSTTIQMQLFKEGKSNCDGITNISKHQYGFAIDFFAYVDDKANYDAGNMALIATCFMEAAAELGHEVNWGGNFGSISDSPHIELVSR